MDVRTGFVFPEMGPNMLWNTRYSPMATLGGGMMGGIGGFALGGMMSGTWGPTAPTTQPTVTPDQAMQIAQQWLDQYRAGNATEAADMFPQNDLPRDREILLICPSGRRSAQAAQLLLSVGHSAVNVAGGMQAWTQASLPVSR